MPRTRTVVGHGVFAVVGGVALVATTVLSVGFAEPYWATLLYLLLQPVSLYTVGLYAYRKAPEHPTAHLLLGVGCAYAVSLAGESVLRSLPVEALPGWWPLVLVAATADIIALIFAARLFGLFPTGRYVRRYEAVALKALWVVAALPVLIVLAGPGLPFPRNLLPSAPMVASPVVVAWLAPLGPVAAGVFEARFQLLPIGLVLLALRYRRASVEQRAKIAWVFYAVALMGALQVVFGLVTASGFIGAATFEALAPYVQAPILTFTLGSTAFALYRYRLLEVELVFKRSIVYAGVWLLIWGGYLGVAAMLGIAVGARLPVAVAIVVTITATLVLAPVRSRLERLAGRLVFGRRRSRYELLSRFGETLERAYDVGELGDQVAESVREGLDLRWVRVYVDLADGGPRELVGSAGPDGAGTPELVAPLVQLGEHLGVIECGPKSEGRVSAADRELLSTIARQAGVGIRYSRQAVELAARLDQIARQAEELGASRARIVAAQDTERRRIERDLHDGIQQELVALVMGVRIARDQLGHDRDGLDATLAALQEQARATLDGLRELAHGIHPSTLTDHGLVAAVEALASRAPIGVAIEAEPDGPRYLEQVEGAAYFVVCEGLANVLKHAQASRVTVRLTRTEGRLVVEVVDDGTGFVPADATGSGLTGLADRVAAIGGDLRILSRPGAGTRLVAELPASVRKPSNV